MPDTNTPETLPAKFEDWTPPWADDPDSFDADRAARRIFGLLQDKQKATTDKASALAAKTAAESERDALQAKIDEAARAGESETDRLKREVETLKAENAKKSETDVERLKLEVALEKGLTAVQARRLIGTTKEELATDADALVESFGGSGKPGDGEDDGDRAPRRTPRRTSTPLAGDEEDPDPLQGSAAEIIDRAIPRNTF